MKQLLSLAAVAALSLLCADLGVDQQPADTRPVHVYLPDRETIQNGGVTYYLCPVAGRDEFVECQR